MAGFLSGIFGSGPDYSNVNGVVGQQNGIAQQYAGLGAQGLSAYGPANQQATASAQNYANYLGSNPYTNSVNSGIVSRNLSGMADAYNRANSQLQSSLFQRGLGAGGSAAVGAQAGLAAREAQQVAGAQNNATNYEIGQTGQRLGEQANVLGGIARNDLSNGFQGYGGANNIYGSTIGTLTNEDNAKYAAQQQGDAMIGQLVGGIAGSAFGVPGLGAGLGSRAAVGGGYGGVNSTPMFQNGVQYGFDPNNPIVNGTLQG